MKDDDSPDFIKIWDSSLGAILFEYRDELDVRRHVGRAFNWCVFCLFVYFLFPDADVQLVVVFVLHMHLTVHHQIFH